MNEEKLKEELEEWDREIALNPKNFTAQFNRGNTLYYLGRKKEALDNYDKALAINPDDDNTYYNRGNILYNLGYLEKALDSYDKALEINPNKEEAYFNKGNVLDDLGRKEEALDSYDKALDINPNKEEAYFNKGIVLKNLGHLRKALDSYNKALSINPNFAAALCNRGNILKDLGFIEKSLKDKQKALSIYNKNFKINPNDDISLTNKGVVLSNLGKQKEALKCYIQAIQINRNNKIAQQKRRALIGSQRFWESLSERSRIDLWSGDDDFNTLVSREKLKGCSNQDLASIHRLWVEQYRLLYLLNADLEQVGHYTSTTVFEMLLQEQEQSLGQTNPLRLCSVAAANDPTEGTVFLSLLKKDCVPSSRIHSNLTVLQTSFSSAIDSLNQFRLYGKKDGEEGTGLCLVFNRSFFAKLGEASMIVLSRNNEQSSMEESTIGHKLPLYWVLYYDCKSGHVYYTPACTGHSLDKEFKITKAFQKESERKKLEDIGRSLTKIRNNFQTISKKYQRTALEMLIYLRHLVKDAAFKDEKELRILSLHPYNDSSLKLLPGKKCLSVNYIPVIHDKEAYLKEVIAGPKLRNFTNLVDVAKFRLHHLGGKKEVVFRPSEAPLS